MLASPCDAIVGACGPVQGLQVFQAKGFAYTLPRLFCRNERAVIHARLGRGGHPVALVPVAAILVASLRLHWRSTLLGVDYHGPDELPCDAGFVKGQEMGWFQHGSTIIVFAPCGFVLAPGIETGAVIRMGQALMRLPTLNP